MAKSKFKIIECPRDAMQGLKSFIPTTTKIKYINQLLKVGYDTIDFGSFVSPKAIPQMRDTAQVLEGLDTSTTKTKLLAIVANVRGAKDASKFERIDYLGYPFSISETFQLRNTNATLDESLKRVASIQNICRSSNKQLVVYLSMGFGNPYGDVWNVEICSFWVAKMEDLGIKTISISDTIGIAKPQSISYLYKKLIPLHPNIDFGAHFHTTPNTWREKIDAAYNAGCQRFDAAIRGYGGCPMAKDDLTGNMPTENLLSYFEDNDVNHNLDVSQFIKSMAIANEVFP